jgi:hypothetical protein
MVTLRYSFLTVGYLIQSLRKAGRIVKRSDVPELQYITHIENLASIVQHGILSHRSAGSMRPVSVADADVQLRRSRTRIPGGLPLHDYVNLYICARNPMLYRLLDQHWELCVIGVSTEVLDFDGVIVTDRNAAKDYVAFRSADEGLAYLDKDLVFAQYWTDSDPVQYRRKHGIKCAEALVPHRIPSEFIQRVRVSCRTTAGMSELTGCGRPVIIDEHLFFYAGRRR